MSAARPLGADPAPGTAPAALTAAGLTLPRVGQGTTRTGPWATASAASDRARIDVLRLGIDLGMTLIDTAELYGGGHAEDVVGRALAGRRDRVVLASKFNPAHSGYGDVVAAAERSLRRLRTDWLDLYQVHWPEPRIPFAETVRALERLVADGKVRAVGLGNMTRAELAAARAAARALPLTTVQVEYSLAQRAAEADVLPYCAAEGLAVLAYSVLDRGALPASGRGRRALAAVAAARGCTHAQVMLAWALARPGVVALVQTASAAHTRENAAAAAIVLDPGERARLDAAFRQRVVRVPPVLIRVRTAANPAGYRTADEARRNPRDLVPAPASLALGLAGGSLVKPLPLAPAPDGAWDLLDGEVLYWAWVLAHGIDEPMPAFVKGTGDGEDEEDA